MGKLILIIRLVVGSVLCYAAAYSSTPLRQHALFTILILTVIAEELKADAYRALKHRIMLLERWKSNVTLYPIPTATQASTGDGRVADLRSSGGTSG